jgi:hypothetical protein
MNPHFGRKVFGQIFSRKKLDEFWSNFGQILDKFWTNSGLIVDKIWTNFGQILDKFSFQNNKSQSYDRKLQRQRCKNLQPKSRLVRFEKNLLILKTL